MDAAGNESVTRPAKVTTPAVLTGHWTNTTIELQWSGAAPAAEVAGYRVYYGRASHGYEFVQDVGTATSTSLSGLQLLVNWYASVVAVDGNGNESAFSNEHIDAIAGRVRVRAQEDDALCWTDIDQCPADPGEIQRNGGWQLLAPVKFPEGDWTNVTVTFRLDSKLCSPPAQGTTSKCGSTNPGGWNPCGDPWDRIAQLFLVLDDCIATGGSCLTANNLELMRAITPFGTDAAPPDGTGQVPARRLTLDITPYVPLLTGTRYVGTEIVNYTQELVRLLRRRGLLEDDGTEVDEEEAWLGAIAGASIRGRIATGPRAGQRMLRLGDRIDPEAIDRNAHPTPRCAVVEGFNVHANVLAHRVWGQGRRLRDSATRYYAWPDLMRRVWHAEVLECPRCQSRLVVLAAIHPPETTRAILECLGLPSRAPPVAPARLDEAEAAESGGDWAEPA